MQEWYYLSKENTKLGPFDTQEIQDRILSSQITEESFLWKNGFQNWVKLELIPEFADKTKPNSQLPEKSKVQGSTIIADLKEMNFKEEVIPLNSKNVNEMSKDFIFWSVSFLAVMPLFIVTLEHITYQLVAFALFFAFLWGVIFKQFIVKTEAPWKFLILSLFGTGIAGIELLLLLHEYLPDFYNDLPSDKNIMVKLAGSILHTGLLEELCKILPVLIYLNLKKWYANSKPAILIGIFSGLGFAAFENLHYSEMSASNSLRYADRAGVAGVVIGTISAQINVMLRALSLVFLHAVYTGIFSYFITVSHISNSRKSALFIVGLLVSATIHGFYNWFHSVQSTLSAIVCAFAFMLFYSYLTKLNLIVSEDSSGLR